MAKTEVDGDQIKDASVDLAVDTTGTLAIGRGGTGQTAKDEAFDALSPMTSKGDLITHDGADAVRKAIGSNGMVPVVDSAQGTGWKWAAHPASEWIFWSSEAVAAVAGQGLDLPAALTELDAGTKGTRKKVESDDIGDLVQIHVTAWIVAALPASTIVVSIRDAGNTANVLATVSFGAAGTGHVMTKSTYAAKPGWLTGGDFDLAAYTSGGNGTAPDIIFKQISLSTKIL